MESARWRVVGLHHQLWLVPWGAEPRRTAERLDARDAQRALRLLLTASPPWGFGAQTLAACARHARAHFPRTVAADRDDVAVVFDAIARGLVVVWREALRQPAAPVGEIDTDPGESIPLASALIPKTWIEIELTDMEGNPRAGERYWIKLTDGSVREGTLDRYGHAYFGDLDPGNCDIRWPDLDQEATVSAVVSRSSAEPPPPAKVAPRRTWVEFELLDMEGGPVANERCEVTLPDGRKRELRTDGAGRVRFDDIDPGQCRIRWPDRDEGVLAEGAVGA